MIINRQSRDAFAQLIETFIHGDITNDEFVAHMDQIFEDVLRSEACDDRALWAIRDMVWYLYDDIRPHRMTGKWASTEEAKEEVERWICFLRSDCLYEWPDMSLITRLVGCVLNLLTLGLAGKLLNIYRERHMRTIGDWDVWPFLHRVDYERSCLRPSNNISRYYRSVVVL